MPIQNGALGCSTGPRRRTGPYTSPRAAGLRQWPASSDAGAFVADRGIPPNKSKEAGYTLVLHRDRQARGAANFAPHAPNGIQ